MSTVTFPPFWIATPPGSEDLDLVRCLAGRAAGLLDLRYGAYGQRLALAGRPAAELTVVVDAAEPEVLAAVRGATPRCARVVLAGGGARAELVAELHRDGVQVGVAVDSRAAARQAEAAGADFVLAAGAEAGGLVSNQTALVLAQALLDEIRIPLVMRASAGPLGTAALLAAGCAACVLDSQFLLVPESPLDGGLKEKLAECSPADTRLVGTWAGRGYRFLARHAPADAEALAEREWSLATGGDAGEWTLALAPLLEQGIAGPLPPVGQGIAFARAFAAAGLSAAQVLGRYEEARRKVPGWLHRGFPFAAGSHVARRHRCKYPIVQGPMACISDRAGLPLAAAREGALPFLATTTLSPAETRQAMADLRASLGGLPFGAGLVRFADPARLDEQVQAIIEGGPDAVIVAGGNPELARRFSEAGIATYLHAPSLDHLRSFLEGGVRGFILEGHESGGHVGALSSLVLWELASDELAGRSTEEVAGVNVLFAGGLATARGALMAAILAAPLVERGLGCGLQLGTAYLATREAIACGAVPATAQQAMLGGESTVTTGQTVNLPCRWLLSDHVRPLLAAELSRRREGVALAERKQAGEHDNFRAMMAGLDGRRPGADAQAPAGEAAGPVCCGQAVAALPAPITIAALHERMTAEAAGLAAAVTAPGAADSFADAIAVVGLGCVFPGAGDPSEFWANITARRSFVREIPPDRWDIDTYYGPGDMEKSASRLGAFVEGFVKDPVKFRIAPSIAKVIDRTQFMALEAAYQALDDAGLLERDFPRERTGVFLGGTQSNEHAQHILMRVCWPEFAAALDRTPAFTALAPATRAALIGDAERTFKEGMPQLNEDTGPGMLGSLLAGRICHCFDLNGPGFVVDSACASSLAALQTAVESLRRREIDLALAGAADTAMSIADYVLFSRVGALSDSGSFPFDERASGFVMGEGAGMLLLKRWADARRDGDRVYALIRGIGASSDGRAKGITAPDARGQARAMTAAYRDATYTPDDITCVEAHGTSTTVGDQTELASLTEVFGHGREPGSIALGSVKSMIGHLKTAAGMAGMIKTVLALHHRTLPPTINCETPRRDVDWARSPFFLNTEVRPWLAHGKPRRAAVNALGFGGINYHVVLEEAPGVELRAEAMVEAELPAQVFLFRAESRARLHEQVAEAAARLTRQPEAFAELALARGRVGPPAGPTLAIVAAGAEELGERLARALPVIADQARDEHASASGLYFGARPLGAGEKLAFLFPGQGAQYVNMGGDLPACFGEARRIFDETDAVARAVVGHGVTDMLVCPGLDADEERRRARILAQADYNHPGLLALEATLCHLLRRAGVNPDLVAGHSLGEYMALEAAGALDLQAAVVLTAVRGQRIHEGAPPGGAMVIVPGPAERVAELIAGAGGFVRVANKNCPAQTVIAGDLEGIAQAQERLAAAGLEGVRLEVPSAFHTGLLAEVAESFRAQLESTPIHVPRIPVACNVTGGLHDAAGPEFAPVLREALVRHMVSPVDFIGNVESLYAAGARVFIEVGPGATLSSFVDNILGERPHHTFATNQRRRSPTLQLLHALAFCAARGLDVEPARLRARPERRPTAPAPQARRARPGRSAAPAAPADVGGGLVAQALAAVDPARREAYLRQRAEFLRGLIQLDFQHFGGAATAAGGQDIERRVIELAARKTGYPAETIHLDLDAEAELGLDSIKQVELMREVQRELGVDLAPAAGGRRHQLTSLRALVELVRERLGDAGLAASGTAATVAPTAAPAPPGAALALPGAAPAPPGAALALPGAAAAPAQPERRTDCHRLVCRPRPAPLPESASMSALAGERVLLLAGEAGLPAGLEDALARAGARVTALASGRLPEGAACDVVIDLSALRERDGDGERSRWWQAAEQRAAWLLGVAQAVLRPGNTRRRWVQVTSLGGELAAGPATRPAALAGIGLGLSRCLAAEQRESLRTLYLDFAPELDDGEVVRAVVGELGLRDGHHEIGYTRQGRQEIHWEVDDGPAPTALALDDESVVLAVGGLRGITAAICRQLAAALPARLVLVGREGPDGVTPPASPPRFAEARDRLLASRRAQGQPIVPAELDRLAWQTVWAEERAFNYAALRASGRAVEFRACDITDAAAVQRLVREVVEQHGRIDVVIQGSGALFEKATLALRPEQFVAGLRPKALGTANLLDALAEVPVRAVLNLSSVVGRWGYEGLAAYAAGHEVAGILLAGRRGRGNGRYANLLYGPWLDVGMTRQGSTLERLRDKNAAFITEESGARYLLGELLSGCDATTAFAAADIVAGGARDPRRWLLDRWTVNADSAEAYRRLDPGRDRFIVEHTVANESLVPAVATIEMMAQVSALLAEPGDRLVACESLVLERPIRFPRGEPREVRIEARRVARSEAGSWFETQVSSAGRPLPDGQTPFHTHARARLCLGTRPPPPALSLLVPSPAWGGYMLPLDDLFDPSRTSLGELYRSPRRTEPFARDGVTGVVEPYRLEAMGPRPFTDNPMRLDAQLWFSDAWAGLAGPNYQHYVESLGSLRWFGEPDPWAPRTWYVLPRQLDEAGLLLDNDAVDEQGRVRESIRGLRKAAALPGDATNLGDELWTLLRENPQRQALARLLEHRGKLALAQLGTGVAEAVLAHADGERELAERLDESERRELVALSLPKRRREWLAGRIAAKSAVRQVVGEARAPWLALRIERDPDGAPRVRLDGAGGLHVSIAHGGEVAIAAASDGAPVGVDVEPVAPGVEEIADSFTTADEIERARRGPEQSRAQILTSIWTAKEAARKVAGPHALAMSELRLERAEAHGEYTRFTLSAPDGARFRAVVFESRARTTRAESAGSAGRAAAREGSGTLSGFPTTTMFALAGKEEP